MSRGTRSRFGHCPIRSRPTDLDRSRGFQAARRRLSHSGGGRCRLSTMCLWNRFRNAIIDFDIAPAAIAAYAERWAPIPSPRSTDHGLRMGRRHGASDEHSTWFLINACTPSTTSTCTSLLPVVRRQHHLRHLCRLLAERGFASGCEAVWREDQAGTAPTGIITTSTLSSMIQAALAQLP
jgi:hypothetical protein